MNKEILLVAETVSNEKGVSRDVIFEAIESALAAATKKRFKEEDVEIRVEIDRVSGDSRTFRVWHVVPDEELYEFGRQLTLDEAHEHDEKLQIGDTYEEEVASESFGRIAAQTAKQVIVQKVREAERRQIVEEYRDRIGELISGVVKKASRDSIVLDLGANAEALITREHMITRERAPERPAARLSAGRQRGKPGSAAVRQPRLPGNARRAVQDRSAGDRRRADRDQGRCP